MVSPTKNRLLGYDLARALAVLGMIIVNFEIVLEADRPGPVWLTWLMGLLHGRAAATFVILAGVGLALRSRRARELNDTVRLAGARRTLWKRAVFLFVVGLAYSPLWPADILHFYGLYIAIGALLLTWSDRGLWAAAMAFAGVFVALLLVFDYEAGWNWETLDYVDFWTPTGMVCHLFFNGFHPVFPWTAFLIVGMWLGRQDLNDGHVRRRVLLGGAGTLVVAETVSWLLERMVLTLDLDSETATALFGTEPMPPMPLYLLSAGGAALAVVTLCCSVMDRHRGTAWARPFVATGQLALTLYVAHVVIGMGLLEALGMLRPQSLTFALGYAVTFYAVGVAFSYAWTRRFRLGPLEWIMRKMT